MWWGIEEVVEVWDAVDRILVLRKRKKEEEREETRGLSSRALTTGTVNNGCRGNIPRSTYVRFWLPFGEGNFCQASSVVILIASVFDQAPSVPRPPSLATDPFVKRRHHTKVLCHLLPSLI